ncbi:hypothetical protein L596_007175 [Steinernema carpocapsae]|uniref:Uncharacterized protein n=1 Tax=Steinernema carpocapsae TaxID=34508 RepID=A0A4U5P972_STECR|nr:hypothetical protein L596_007175 [Steinernema carpocapsae]
MIGESSSGLHQLNRHLFGLVLLVFVNILWVSSAELARVIFIDDSFRRPFFVTYVKTCLLVVYIFKYWLCGPLQTVVSDAQTESKYSLLLESDDEYEPESLTNAEFEPIAATFSDSEAAHDREPTPASSPSKERRKRRVRFSLIREVRKLPSAIAEEARKARLPYRPMLLATFAHGQKHYRFGTSVASLFHDIPNGFNVQYSFGGQPSLRLGVPLRARPGCFLRTTTLG